MTTLPESFRRDDKAASDRSSSELATIRDILDADRHNTSRYYFPDFEQKDQRTVADRTAEAEARIKEAQADDARGDVALKKRIAYVIIGILVFQTVLVFYISISQAMGHPLFSKNGAFNLTEWNFRTLIAGTLTETYFLMRIVVSYLFPNRHEHHS